jgi:hypothetical protein
VTRSLLALLVSALSVGAQAAPEKPHRSSAAVRQFKAVQPCPETGDRRGACPGWVVDHVVPLCAGGADDPGNMQWQTVAEAKAKDREEHRQCRDLRKQRQR